MGGCSGSASVLVHTGSTVYIVQQLLPIFFFNFIQCSVYTMVIIRVPHHAAANLGNFRVEIIRKLGASY